MRSEIVHRIRVGVGLWVATLCFWKLRVFDRGSDPTIEVGSLDLYIEHIPMAQYGYEELARGSLPLWNPYQFFGQPFHAIPHTALLYPLHGFSLVLDAPTAVEVSFVVHMFLGAAGMWGLARRFGTNTIGAAASALTFAWSGSIVFTSLLPGLFAAMNWLPLTILLLDHALERSRMGLLGLMGAVACQILLGASEVLLHNFYVAAAYALCRLIAIAREQSPAVSAARASWILAALVATGAITSPQLLPSLLMVAESQRGSGLSFEAAAFGAIPSAAFAKDAIAGVGLVMVGFLPWLGIPLLVASPRRRFVSIFALALAAIAALLVFGGTFYRFYHALPIVGDLFRRPSKFLDIYAFGQALVAGLAITRLEELRDWPAVRLWRSPGFLSALGLAIGALAWTSVGRVAGGWVWLAAALGLVAFALACDPRWRKRVLLGLCFLQAASLFFMVGGSYVRPAARPEIFHSHDALFERLRGNIGTNRVYLSPNLSFVPGLTAKQGMLQRVKVASDYEPLISSRTSEYLLAITPAPARSELDPFAGWYFLGPDTNWNLLDATATRFFVMSRDEPGARSMRNDPAHFRSIHKRGWVEVFERDRALQRAYFVPSARRFDNASAILRAMRQPDFDPRREVLLEGSVAPRRGALASAKAARVEFAVDDAEEVVLAVSAPTPGYLVLSDAYARGWRAFDGRRELEILRANHLFRAVEVEAGISQIRFVYQPRSLRIGWLMSAATLALILCACILAGFRGSRETRQKKRA